jgi:dTMP kinase
MVRKQDVSRAPAGPPHEAALRFEAPQPRRRAQPVSGRPMLDTLVTRHPYPGRLFAVEGIDGSGKSTQAALLAKWLSARGHSVFVTEWNSSLLVKAATKRGKKKNVLTPTTFSLLHATDFADRLMYKIVPPLKAGMIVLADRYAYTAFARDVARGVDPGWVRALYGFAVKPDLALYFRVPLEVSLDRLLARRVKLKFYEAGMDLGLSSDVVESFRLFQGHVIEEYDAMTEEFGLQVVDARGSISEQQNRVRELVASHLEPALEASADV